MCPDLVVPFRGERYGAVARLSRLVAPPYDVIAPAQRARYAAQDAHNIVHVMLPEAEGGGDRYAAAAALLAAWRTGGVLVRDPSPGVYVLAQDFHRPGGGRSTRIGMFAALAAEGYDARRVRPHEKTHAGPKADRLALLRATRTNVESIFVIAPDPDGALAAALHAATAGRPAATAELDGVGLRLWPVFGPDAARLCAPCNPHPVYMADGHHRYETASAYAQEAAAGNRVLALVVSARDEGLIVLATHRVIRGAPVRSEELLPAWRERFDVVALPADADPVAVLHAVPPDVIACVVAWPDGTQLLRLRPDAAGPGGAEAAVALLETRAVQPIVLKAQTAELLYTADAGEALAAARGGAVASVLLRPSTVAEVMRVADAGGIMPPKSTYFAPKVPAGLVLKAAD